MKKDNSSIVVCNADYLSSVGLNHILDNLPGVKPLATLRNQDQLENFLRQKQPDLIIIDYHLSDSFGTESISLIQDLSPHTQIMVISNDDDRQRIFEVLERGVKSYITKNCGKEEILKSIENTLKGQKFFCSKVLDMIIEKSFARSNEKTFHEDLTQREKEIMDYIARGLTAKEISAELHISIHTIYTHRKNIIKKLKLKSPVELIIHALNQSSQAKSTST